MKKHSIALALALSLTVSTGAFAASVLTTSSGKPVVSSGNQAVGVNGGNQHVVEVAPAAKKPVAAKKAPSKKAKKKAATKAKASVAVPATPDAAGQTNGTAVVQH